MICGCPLLSRCFCRRHVPHSSLGQPVALVQSQGCLASRRTRDRDVTFSRGPKKGGLFGSSSFFEHTLTMRPAFDRAIGLRSLQAPYG